HARMFWANADLSTDTQASDSSASDTKLSAGLSEAVVDYLAYVLIDLLAVVGELDEPLLAWLMTVADTAGCGPRFDHHVNTELRVTKKVMAKVRREKDRLVAKAATTPSTSAGGAA
ncbi:MAG: hypothetical protein ACI9MR_001941, partial [Myxococcota bacterium]